MCFDNVFSRFYLFFIYLNQLNIMVEFVWFIKMLQRSQILDSCYANVIFSALCYKQGLCLLKMSSCIHLCKNMFIFLIYQITFLSYLVQIVFIKMRPLTLISWLNCLLPVELYYSIYTLYLSPEWCKIS